MAITQHTAAPAGLASSMRTIRFASAFAATPSCARPIAPGDAEHLGAPLEALTFLDERHIRQLREIKARTYANLFGLVERIVALAQAQSATSQAPATAGMHRLGEALAEQQMFRHFERMAAASQAEGYAFEPEALLAATRNKSPWALFAFIYCIEL